MTAHAVSAQQLSENRLLATLRPELFDAIAPLVQRVPLAVRDRIFDARRPITHAYFPTEGVASLLAPIEGAPEALVEVATIGNEGMVGLPLFLGADQTPSYAFCQVAGQAFRMTAAAFHQITRTHDAFARMLHRYTQAFFVQISQNTACNRIHTTQERCARWLLMTHDRVHSDEFGLAQQFLGQMLGERRSSVSVVAASLQRAGLIRYVRGRLTVLDRAGLEAAACGCYQIVRDEYDAMLGLPRAASAKSLHNARQASEG